jgi:hypothetical protein
VQVNLSWGPVANALYYRIYRGVMSGGPYTLAAQSNPNPGNTSTSTQIVTTYQDGPGNLVNGQNYYYVITTVTVDGESPYSTEIAALAPSAPSAPAVNTAVVS